MSRNKPYKPRVFCIGWHKTGTSTMGLALLELGYTVLGARLDMDNHLLKGDLSPALKEAGKFDALQDVPWAALYQELDQQYPGSKFILTVREEQTWLHSASKHFKDTDISLHKWLYGKGILLGNEELYLERYRQHYEDVKKYFAGRNDFIQMDLASGDGWNKLCNFLEEPIPRKAFPHSNKGKHSYSLKDKMIHTIKRMVPELLRKKRVEVLERLGLHTGPNHFNNQYQNKKWREENR